MINQLKYPIYIVSKGRWENPITAKRLMRDNVPFKIVVEPQEVALYQKTLPSECVQALPFQNLGLGSYPARNWCWEDSKEKGFKRHFLFDDNIYGFIRLNAGLRKACEAVEPLISLQNFTDRYSNIGIAGYNYASFVTRETKKAFFLNVHVYSGMLITNEMPFRWRMKYNEDVDLCLQALHAKWCTVLLNVFLINKVSTTAKLKGGNQDELYKGNDPGKKMLKSKSLQMVWPEYAEVKMRFGRPHHYVNWRKHFKHDLIKIIQS